MNEKERSLEEWIAFYNRKVPYPFKRDERFKMLYRPSKGFCEIGYSGDMAIAKATCGDIHFWRKVIENFAHELNLSKCGVVTCRKILPYIRLSGFEIVKVEETVDGKKYYCKDKVTGQEAQCSPAGGQWYFVIWRVDSDDKV